jgi:multiple sugar transport system substrate-binding protein
LEPFIAAEADFEKDGYHQAMLSLSTFDDAVYGLPFSISLPVGYYNMDILRAGGIEELPQTWDDVIAACETMKANGIDNPIFWGWNITGNWFVQALLWSQLDFVRILSGPSPEDALVCDELEGFV